MNNYEKIYISKPSITSKEIEYVNDAVTNGWGEKPYDYIFKFEKLFAKYMGTNHALATSSCTGAIHLALMAMGVKAGDEVIIPEITWIASVEPILYIGAKPIFVDVLEDSWCIDPVKFEKMITKKTKAVIVVHLYGNLVDMGPILAIAAKHGIKVLEDAAEGFGSEYRNKKAGSIGDVGVFSFHGTKTITTGEGGMLVTNDNTIFERATILNDHGRDPKDHKTFWMKEYGYKYKMSNLQAAMGCAQIERAEELVEKKREIFSWYKNLFADTDSYKMNPEPEGTKNSYWMSTLLFDKKFNIDREKLFLYLKDYNIDSRPFFYPLSSLPMFSKREENTVAHDVFTRGINLPSYHDLTHDKAQFVSQKIKEYLGSSQ